MWIKQDPSASTYFFLWYFLQYVLIFVQFTRAREQEVRCLHQKAGELRGCSPASPSNFCVPLTDRSVQDLLSLQTPPDCPQLVDFKLIALPIYSACWGSQCFAVFGFYPSVYSEIKLMVLLLSLMPLYLNSNHRKFEYGLKLHRCLFCLSVCHWVPGLPSVHMGLRHLWAQVRGGIALQKDPPAWHWCSVSKGFSCITPVWISSAKQGLWPGLSASSIILSGCCKLYQFFSLSEGEPEGWT